jgi:hypothetical protein
MKRLALDANVLILLVVGLVDRNWIGRHRRLRNYTESDFDLLQEILRPVNRVVLTPNTATEASNLLEFGVDDPIRMNLLAMLGEVICNSEERYVPSSDACESSEFTRLGLTDSAWLQCLGDDEVILTEDNALFIAALTRGMIAYRFSDVRRYRRMQSPP